MANGNTPTQDPSQAPTAGESWSTPAMLAKPKPKKSDDFWSGINEDLGRALTTIIGPGGINPYGNQYGSSALFQHPTEWHAAGEGIYPGTPSGGTQDPTAGMSAIQRTLYAGAHDPNVAAYLSAGQQQAKDQQSQSPTDNALTMGLGMFIKQFLVPAMAQQNQQNQAQVNQWGGLMQQAMKQPMPAGARQILQAAVPEQMSGMKQLAAESFNQAQSADAFQSLQQGIGGETSALQQAIDAFQKAATAQTLNINPTALGALISNQLQGTQIGALAQLLGGGNSLLSTAAGANAAAGAGYTGATGTG